MVAGYRVGGVGLVAAALTTSCLVIRHEVRLAEGSQLMGHDAYLAVRLDALRDQVARDLGCTSNIAVRATAANSDAFAVDACGRRVIYGEVSCYGGGLDYTVRFVPISEEVAHVDRYGGRFCTGAEVVKYAAELAALNAQGARDLHCAREAVVPSHVPNGKGAPVPVAEGCGHRATYLPGSPLKLSSMVSTDERSPETNAAGEAQGLAP